MDDEADAWPDEADELQAAAERVHLHLVRRELREARHEGSSFVELRICLREPADLVDLVGAFAAVASQFDQYIRNEHPNLKRDARLFVKDSRQGSIIVELIPVVILPLIENMDRVLIVRIDDVDLVI